MPDGKNLKTIKQMGAIKNFYHDRIEKESRKINDSTYAYRMSEELKQYYFEESFNKKLTKWQKLLIQLKAWRSQSISTITNFWKTKNLF